MQALLLACALACQSGEPMSDPVVAVAAQLRAAIELVTPKERRAAALAIAKRKEASIDVVSAAIEIAARRAPVEPGTHVERAPIWADGKVEDVELVTYVPKGYDPRKPAPLFEVFHYTGGSANGQDHMWRATCDALGAVLVAPGEAGENEGYAWTMRERDAAIGALRWAMLRFNVDPDRVYATGVSRGGHLVWDVALRRPDRYAALAPFIGCPRFQLVRGQNNMRFLENVVGVPIRDLQGSQDDPGVIENLHDAFARLDALGAKDAKLIEFPEKGHSFEFGAVDWVDFLERARRDPKPDHVVLASANLAEARAFWVEIVQFGRDVAENPRLDVRAAEWGRLDAAGQRRFVQARIDESTARLAVTRTQKGRYAVEERGVAKLRLLLAADDLDRGAPIEILFRGKRLERRATGDPRVALCDYVERLDASFVPVAAVEVP